MLLCFFTFCLCFFFASLLWALDKKSIEQKKSAKGKEKKIDYHTAQKNPEAVKVILCFPPVLGIQCTSKLRAPWRTCFCVWVFEPNQSEESNQVCTFFFSLRLRLFCPKKGKSCVFSPFLSFCPLYFQHSRHFSVFGWTNGCWQLQKENSRGSQITYPFSFLPILHFLPFPSLPILCILLLLRWSYSRYNRYLSLSFVRSFCLFVVKDVFLFLSGLVCVCVCLGEQKWRWRGEDEGECASRLEGVKV